MQNENGEDIIIEGIHGKRTAIWCCLALFYISLIVMSFGTGILFIPCIIGGHYYCAKKWRLYLTRTDIHYNPGLQYTVTPLTQIAQISVIPGTENIQIVTKHGSIYNNARGITITNMLKIDHVTNCREFVEAVKTEMARSQQS